MALATLSLVMAGTAAGRGRPRACKSVGGCCGCLARRASTTSGVMANGGSSMSAAGEVTAAGVPGGQSWCVPCAPPAFHGKEFIPKCSPFAGQPPLASAADGLAGLEPVFGPCSGRGGQESFWEHKKLLPSSCAIGVGDECNGARKALCPLGPGAMWHMLEGGGVLPQCLFQGKEL